MALDEPSFDAQIAAAIDSKTKPVGSLGRIETLAAQIARIQMTLAPRAESSSLTIFAADHGMATAGVSAFPQAVTQQMVLNFVAGGAAANVFARTVGATVQVVDAGVAGDPINHPDLLDRRIGPGTQNALAGAAMSAAQLDTAIDVGLAIGRGIDSDIACFGEMGIGNTSSATLVAAKVLGRSVADLTGRGTGLDDNGLQNKLSLLSAAAKRTPDQLDAELALSEYGGFEIAMMAGAMIGAADTQRIIIVDGFIATAAALCATRLFPPSADAFIYAHQSAESGHRVILEALDADPLLQFNMRLGEGTGALLAVPLVKAAAAMLRDMASFESAGVSGPT
jgi:nicotinate-nucleotide--dimethylbenzimidazole phosphoribosyltransferase